MSNMIAFYTITFHEQTFTKFLRILCVHSFIYSLLYEYNVTIGGLNAFLAFSTIQPVGEAEPCVSTKREPSIFWYY